MEAVRYLIHKQVLGECLGILRAVVGLANLILGRKAGGWAVLPRNTKSQSKPEPRVPKHFKGT